MTRIQYNTLKSMFDDMCKEVGMSIECIDKYFTPIGITDMRGDGFTTEHMIVCRLCSSLQSGQDGKFMSYAIKFNGANRRTIQSVLFDFDAEKIAAAYPNGKALYNALSSNCTNTADTSAWEIYAKGILEGVAFLLHNNFGGFDLVKDLIDLNDSDILTFQPWLQKDIQTLSENISELSYVLACDWLKECGCTWLVRPSGYIRDIFRVLYPDLDTEPQTIVATLYNSVQALKADNPAVSDLTPYKLEQMIRIVCSGNFFKDSIKIAKRKPDLFSTLF